MSKINLEHNRRSVLDEGGEWLKATRSRIQVMFQNGDTIIWGSEEKLLPTPSIRQIEEIAATAVAADRNSRESTK